MLITCFAFVSILGMGRLSANAEEIEINDMRDYLLSIQMPESYLDALTDE